MTSQYVKCDGCGGVLDRWPVELSRGDGTFGRGGAVRAYGATVGWVYIQSDSDHDKDYCPKCRPVAGPTGL